MSKTSKKRLHVEIPNVLYKELQRSAEFRNLTVTRWLLQAIVMKLQNDEKFMPKGT